MKAGQLIAELDPRDQQAALKAAEDNIKLFKRGWHNPQKHGV